MDPVRWLPQLEALVRGIGAFQLEGARSLRPEHVQVKRGPTGERSIVTRYDTESEARLHDFVRREFPGHSFLGEETGNDLQDPDHYWIVDPIDGTTNFTHGIPYWGPSLAYWHRGEPQLAVIYFPVLDSMFTAWRGRGACLNGERIHTSDTREYSMLTTVALHSRSHLTHSLRLRAKVRVLGSIIGNMCYTALGTFVAAHGRGRLWDLAAGILVLEEAGAIVETQPDLRRLDIPNYARDGSVGEIMVLLARANEHLPPLSNFLEPARPPTPAPGDPA